MSAAFYYMCDGYIWYTLSCQSEYRCLQSSKCLSHITCVMVTFEILCLASRSTDADNPVFVCHNITCAMVIFQIHWLASRSTDYLCDGYLYISDTLTCQSEYRCLRISICLPQHYLCDGYIPNTLICQSEYRCLLSSICLPQHYLCYGYVSDTMTCESEYRCLQSSICLPRHYLCDGYPQCPLGDDERLCNYTWVKSFNLLTSSGLFHSVSSDLENAASDLGLPRSCLWDGRHKLVNSVQLHVVR